MKDKIQKAYHSAAPDQAQTVRIYEQILRLADAETERAARRSAGFPRRLAIAAAAVAVIVLMASAGYAAYQHWVLPAPETYEPGNNGIYQEHDRKDYNLSELDSHAATDLRPADGTAATDPRPADGTETTETPSAAPLTDEAFIYRGLDILTQVGMLDVRPEQLTVVRQDNLYWGREEAEVVFDQGDVRTSVRFNAATGRFLGMSGIDWQLEGTTACGTDAEAGELAQRFYEALPVEQGYSVTHVEKYNEQYWSYEYCREVEPGVFNQYEMVRVAINPVSGRLTGCTVFYVPLLDDHEPGQERISRQDAEQIVQSSLPELLDGMTLTKAEVTIAHPNWNYTEYQDNPNRRASDVTRWAWALTYETPNSEFADMVILFVDCYTGEILGGDATK